MTQELAKIKLDTRPLYVRAERALSQLLNASDPGEQLPPEPKLAHMLGISRSTLREALRSFERQGLITRRRGIGTFVSRSRQIIESNLETLESIDSLARRMGLECVTRDLEVKEESSSAEIAGHLGIAEDSPVISISRIKVAQGQAVAYMHDVFPATLVDIQTIRAKFKGSAIDFLLEQGIPKLSYAWTNISATQAGSRIGGKLGIDPHCVLLLLEEIVYSEENVTVEYSRNYFVPEYFNFHLMRRIKS